jgi:FlaA1/EpsC-like NDP-sugar epimerase
MARESISHSSFQQTLRRLPARQVKFASDLAVLVAAFLLAYLLRFDFSVPDHETAALLIQLPLVVLIQFGSLSLMGVYSFIWRYVGVSEVKSFIYAAFWSFIPIVTIRLGLPSAFQELRVPLSIILTNHLLAFGGILGLRVLRRVIYERYERNREAANGNHGSRAVLLVGAGRAGGMAAKEIRARGDMDLEVKGFVDDDPNKQGSVIHGIRVLGKTEDLPGLVTELGIDHVVITIAQASRRDFRRILGICEGIPVRVRAIPPLCEILQGRVKVTRIRDLQIEDLLGREPVELEEDKTRQFLLGKTVMVTGAGGSIGSELARQVARFQPANLLLVERAEFALFDIDRELTRDWPDLSQVPLVADICDRGRMRAIFSDYCPDVVLHAAAHKHVPMMEWNAAEAVKNNVLATHLLGELSGEFGVDVFVLISTDKAVRPSSVMGASKRVAELVVQNLNRRFATRYEAVRFGNVIGSAGSVIPIFRDQILNGGPVSVTHPEMTRYFMTIPEAAQLVLQAGAMGMGGEIFILDMGEPVRILDLAKDAIILSGLKPFEDIDIIFTGMRPGEKLFEELEMNEEHLSKTQHPKIFIGKIAEYEDCQVRFALERLAQLTANGKDFELRQFLTNFLPEANLEDSGTKISKITLLPVSQPTAAINVVWNQLMAGSAQPQELPAVDVES